MTAPSILGVEWAAASGSSNQIIDRPPYTKGDMQIVIAGGGHHVTGVNYYVPTTDLLTGQEAQGFLSVELSNGYEQDPLEVFWDGPDPHAVTVVSIGDSGEGFTYDWQTERVGAVGASYPAETTHLPLTTSTDDRLIVLAFARNATTLPALAAAGAPDQSAVVGGSSMALWVIEASDRTNISVTMPAGRSGHYVAAVRVRRAAPEIGTIGGPTEATATNIEQDTISADTPVWGGGLESTYGGVQGQRWWRYVPHADGLLRTDLLLSSITYGPATSWIQLLVSDEDGNVLDEVEFLDTTHVVWRVEEGRTYFIRALFYGNFAVRPPSSDFYVLRVGELQEAEWVQAPSVDADGIASTRTYTGSWDFLNGSGAPHPGLVREAMQNEWELARRRTDATVFWTGTPVPHSYGDFDFDGAGGVVGWSYSVDADEFGLAGSAGFNIFMPWATFTPQNTPGEGTYNILGAGPYGTPHSPTITEVQALFGDDVLAYDDDPDTNKKFTVPSMDVIGAITEDGALGGEGAGEPKWSWGYEPSSSDDKMNVAQKWGFTSLVTREAWVPINPDAETFNALCWNAQTNSDQLPKIGVPPADIPLTSADYSVHGTWSGQRIYWRAVVQPNAFRVFRRPPEPGDEEEDPIRLWPRDDSRGPMGSGDRLYPPQRWDRVVAQQQ